MKDYVYHTYDDFAVTLAGNFDKETDKTCRSVWEASRKLKTDLVTRKFLKENGWKEDPDNGTLSYKGWKTITSSYDFIFNSGTNSYSFCGKDDDIVDEIHNDSGISCAASLKWVFCAMFLSDIIEEGGIVWGNIKQ